MSDINSAHLFLENGDNPKTQAFIKARNEASAAALKDADFKHDRQVIQAILEDDDRLIVPGRRGNWLYDFHRSAENPRGIWRRIADGAAATPDAPWETVFDVDAFCAAEERSWAWRGVVTSPYDPDRVLLKLSDGGSDPLRFIEFDCRQKKIVKGGFDIAPAKADACWETPDTLILCTSVGEGAATASGWPGAAKRLMRGDDPATAPVLFSAENNDLLVHADVISEKGRRLTFFALMHTIHAMSVYLSVDDGNPIPLDAPREAEIRTNQAFYAYQPRQDGEFPAGSLVLASLPHTAKTRRSSKRIVFTPQPRVALRYFFFTRQQLIYAVNDNLTPKLFSLDLDDETAEPREIEFPDGFESLDIFPLDAEALAGDGTLQVIGQGNLQPRTLFRISGPATVTSQPQKTMSAPKRFDASGMESLLLEAKSNDGTMIPYHLVLPAKDKRGNGCIPVLQYGYGGFDVALDPGYLGILGKLWLERGGAYVQAHIRGGGEFGPGWHQAATRHDRHKAFEDFAAVADDLVARGYTKPSLIAAHGGSNGGLLCGVMLTRYPEKFGAIRPAVPVLDMMRFAEFDAGKAWVDEYGDAANPDDRAALLAYSPLHNIAPAKDQTYPPVYIESAANDDRVHPSHARRMAAALKEAGHDVLFHEFGSGGHGGDGATHEQAVKMAMGLAFLRRTIVRNAMDH